MRSGFLPAPRRPGRRAAGLPDCRRFYQIVPEVRTPGLPENVRRLGDLRLECKVMIEIAKEERFCMKATAASCWKSRTTSSASA